MKKIEKMIHQIIRFRGKIEAFLVSIEEFSSPTFHTFKTPDWGATSTQQKLASSCSFFLFGATTKVQPITFGTKLLRCCSRRITEGTPLDCPGTDRRCCHCQLSAVVRSGRICSVAESLGIMRNLGQKMGKL